MSCVPDRRVRGFLELLLFSRNTGPAHTHIHTHTCTHASTHTHTHIHTHTYTYTYTHRYTHTYTHAYTHIHAYIHTHIHTGAYTCTHACAQIDDRPQGSLVFKASCRNSQVVQWLRISLPMQGTWV